MRVAPVSIRSLGMAALIGALIAFPLGVLASHDFSDVPDTNPFHDDIHALYRTGITSGCGGGKYCPSAYVTREQMAAFLNRLGALGPGKVPIVNADRLDGLDSGVFARADQVQHYSCLGNDMAAMLSATTYGGSFGWRYLTSGNDYLTCAVHLPDGAIVTALTAEINDTSELYETHCGLYRANAVSFSQMADTPNSGAMPGPTTVVDDTIQFEVIDNLQYGYTANCPLIGAAEASLFVARVTVTYFGAP